MPQESKITLLIADDHEVVRSGLKGMLAGTQVQVVAAVTSAQAAVKYALENQMDVVLLDIRISDGDGLNALGRIKLEKPDLPILMFSNHDNAMYASRAVALGASGYLLKDCTRDELVHAIKTVATGENLWTRDELRRMTGALATPRLTADVEVPLTQREGEVLRHVAMGLTNKQITEALHMNVAAVKEHVRRILDKIGVVGRTQAALWAVRKELV
jgi:DNA-binding NarL/FixJ family response regulator